MEFGGYIAAILIGVSLGLVGGGGTILTLPVLVYLFNIAPLTAISYSLFIVGLTSLVGAVNNYRKGFVNMRVAVLFGLPSLLTVIVIRKFLLPVIPALIPIGNRQISFSVITMVIFAILMVFASYSMIKPGNYSCDNAQKKYGNGLLILLGIGIGIITGFLGAGGGFILIPALVLLLHLDMKQAIGTSLLIIAINSLVGFTSDIGHYLIDWKLVLVISALAITGIITGGLIARRIHGVMLKKGFGWFVLVMGIYIISRELFT